MRSVAVALCAVLLFCGLALADGAVPRYVLAFYYPWYRTPFYSGYWGHWNGDGHNPDEFVDEGRRDIAAVHYPASDVYDSLDPQTIARHIEESRAAGIDGWIVSWWGQDDEEVAIILDYLEEQGSNLKVAVYYEIVPGCGGQDYLCQSVPPEEKIRAVEDDLFFIIDNFGSHPNYLKVGGRPVIFVYTRAIAQAYFQWSRIISDVRAMRAFYISGDSNLTLSDFIIPRAFDHVHFYNPTWQIRYLGFDTLNYCDYVRRARAQGFGVALTVIPGYDDSALVYSRPHPIIIDRQDGELYRALWDISIGCRPDWILVTSFNEWHEGTEIEPSLEFGGQYIELTAQYARRFKLMPVPRLMRLELER